MSATGNRSRACLALTATLVVSTGVLFAQSTGGEFTLKKSVLASGSATVAGGDFRSSATAGQHDAGTSSGGDFRVQGGFWPAVGGAPPPDGSAIFCDGFEDTPCASGGS
jgi:hypothetical protein